VSDQCRRRQQPDARNVTVSSGHRIGVGHRMQLALERANAIFQLPHFFVDQRPVTLGQQVLLDVVDSHKGATGDGAGAPPSGRESLTHSAGVIKRGTSFFMDHHWTNHSVTNGSIFALFDRYLIRRVTMKKLVPKKTRKAIRKSLRKIIKKHGPELAAAVAGGALGKTVSDALASNGKKSRKQSQSEVKAGKKKAKHGSKRAQQTDQLEMER
jgi:hypothetical protein